MVHEGYEETESGEIPEDWDFVSFQDILDSCNLDSPKYIMMQYIRGF